MAAEYHTIDLARLTLASGEARRLDLRTDPGSLRLGGQRYEVPAGVATRLDISRTLSGYALRLRFEARLEGPCMRCLQNAALTVPVDAREVDQPGTVDEELRSPYVDGTVLDLSAWAHDALALALPQAILCRADCAGLCAVCGEPLGDVDGAEHRHEPEPDPRWAKLRELS